jgi:hypothetical protein
MIELKQQGKNMISESNSKPNKNPISMKTNKTRMRMSMVAIVVLLAASACKKDEVAVAPTNTFTIKGATKTIKGVSFLYSSASVTSGTGKTYYVHDLILYTDGFTVSNGLLTGGKGDAVGFTVYGSSKNLDAGTYTLNNTKANFEPLQMYGSAFLNYDLIAKTGDESMFTATSLVVTKSGDTYTIKGTDAASATVLQYTGLVTLSAK